MDALGVAGQAHVCCLATVRDCIDSERHLLSQTMQGGGGTDGDHLLSFISKYSAKVVRETVKP